MRDLYKRLNLSDDANEDAIRGSLARADPQLRTAAEAILLDPRRRPVYDRNRRLLLTIASVRFELGLNFTRFWSRKEFKDFWQTPQFIPPPEDSAPKRRVDQMMIAQAFHAARKVHHHGRHHAARWGWLWIAIVFLGAVALLIALMLLKL